MIYYKRRRIALLGEMDDGEVFVAHRLEDPFVCDNWGVSWPNLDAAMSVFAEIYSVPAIRRLAVGELAKFESGLLRL